MKPFQSFRDRELLREELQLRREPRECMKLQLPQALFPTSGLGYWYRAVPS